MLSPETIAVLDAFISGYGNLSRRGQYRLISLLENIQRMTPDQVTLVLSEIRELKPIT